MELLEGIVNFTIALNVFWNIIFPVILDIIWIKRVKSGKSKVFGLLGIISIIFTVIALVNLPRLFTIIGEYYGWI